MAIIKIKFKILPNLKYFKIKIPVSVNEIIIIRLSFFKKSDAIENVQAKKRVKNIGIIRGVAGSTKKIISANTNNKIQDTKIPRYLV